MAPYEYAFPSSLPSNDDIHFLSPSPPTSPTATAAAAVKRLKCVLVGDCAVGKTSLIVSYTTNGYPRTYIPTAFDNYSVSVRVDDKPICLQLCDTAGQIGFNSLRTLCYPETDVFLLCFSVVDPTSFYNLQRHWLPEIRRHSTSSKTALLLIGTQSDRRSDLNSRISLANNGEIPVSQRDALEFARDCGALQFVECSALTQRNLKEVFDAAILAALQIDSNTNASTSIDSNRIYFDRNDHQFCMRKSFSKFKDKLTNQRKALSSTTAASCNDNDTNYRSWRTTAASSSTRMTSSSAGTSGRGTCKQNSLLSHYSGLSTYSGSAAVAMQQHNIPAEPDLASSWQRYGCATAATSVTTSRHSIDSGFVAASSSTSSWQPPTSSSNRCSQSAASASSCTSSTSNKNVATTTIAVNKLKKRPWRNYCCCL